MLSNFLTVTASAVLTAHFNVKNLVRNLGASAENFQAKEILKLKSLNEIDVGFV